MCLFSCQTYSLHQLSGLLFYGGLQKIFPILMNIVKYFLLFFLICTFSFPILIILLCYCYSSILFNEHVMINVIHEGEVYDTTHRRVSLKFRVHYNYYMQVAYTLSTTVNNILSNLLMKDYTIF